MFDDKRFSLRLNLLSDFQWRPFWRSLRLTQGYCPRYCCTWSQSTRLSAEQIYSMDITGHRYRLQVYRPRPNSPPSSMSQSPDPPAWPGYFNHCYEGYQYPHFWTEGYRTPTFQDEKVNNFLLSADNSGALRRLNYNKTVFIRGPSPSPGPWTHAATFSQTLSPPRLATKGELIAHVLDQSYALHLCHRTRHSWRYVLGLDSLHTLSAVTVGDNTYYRVALKKTGPPSHCKYSEIPWPNCVEIGELLQYYMLNTDINFLFKNFIALWRHLAKTQLLSFIHIVQIDLSITQ